MLLPPVAAPQTLGNLQPSLPVFYILIKLHKIKIQKANSGPSAATLLHCSKSGGSAGFHTGRLQMFSVCRKTHSSTVSPRCIINNIWQPECAMNNLQLRRAWLRDGSNKMLVHRCLCHSFTVGVIRDGLRVAGWPLNRHTSAFSDPPVS